MRIRALSICNNCREYMSTTYEDGELYHFKCNKCGYESNAVIIDADRTHRELPQIKIPHGVRI